MINGKGAISIQSDLTILLDDQHAQAVEIREKLNVWTELLRRAGHIHMYKVTPLTLWNAVSMGENEREWLQWLKQTSANGLPLKAEGLIRAWINRFGKIVLYYEHDQLTLVMDNSLLQTESLMELIHRWAVKEVSHNRFMVSSADRGVIKQELTRAGYPVIDQAGYTAGEELSVELRTILADSSRFLLRDYQKEAVARWKHQTELLCGSGVAVLPCGAGKTIIGIAALADLKKATLILTVNISSAEQWRNELLHKTTLTEEDIGLYCGSSKKVRPVTIATYHMLTRRSSRKEQQFTHMNLFSERSWGLIIYDEVHLLPAPVFRMTADIQATRRLGLTATLIREDGCAEDVYSLIGPKIFDMNWRKAEEKNVIAKVYCTEVRVSLSDAVQQRYNCSGARERLRIASENPAKIQVLRELIIKHQGKPTLIIGQYLTQLHEVAKHIDAPVLTGEVSQEKRRQLFEQFRTGEIEVLIVSKVANLAVDLPDAAVAIQISGSFGSRQEEAQRIGRLLRPKKDSNEAWFYTLVSDGTKETEFSLKRQLFMLEQGYSYDRISDQELVTVKPASGQGGREKRKGRVMEVKE